HSLEDLTRFAAPEDQVEGGHRDLDFCREPLDPCLDVQVSPWGQGPRQPPEDAVTDQVPEDVTVQYREVLPAARVPEKMTGLLQPQAADFADEPPASILRRRESIYHLRELSMASRE